MSEPVITQKELTTHLNKLDELEARVKLAVDVLNTALDEAPDAILIVNTSGTVVYANKMSTNVLGYTPTQLKGKKVEELMPERFREVHPKHREEYLKHPYPRSMGQERALNLMVLQPGNAKVEVPVDINLNTFQCAEGTTYIIVIIRRKDVANG
jgi:PAS domain S-box-containing protein